MSTAIAIDPGQTTGIAVRMNAGGGVVTNTCVVTSAEEVWKYVAGLEWSAVIIERFATAGYLSKYGLHTIEIVGGVKALCYTRALKLVVHTPQFRYPYMTEAKAFLADREHMVHEVDALAHLLAYYGEGEDRA